MSQRFVPFLVALALVAGSAVPASPQELRGRITGVVTDNTGAVLPGATVTVAGPALIQPQTTVTAADGTYRYPALPPGLYTVSFELGGFQTLKREGIRLGLNQTLTVDAQLQLSSIQETVTITGDSPVVDVKSTTVGTNFTKELLQDIPNARDIWAAMAQAPGFQMTGYDVGGSRTGTQTGYQTYGVTGQNKTLFEGINVTEGQDANAGYFDFGSFEEFQLGGSGNMGEQSGLGAFLNLTVKSGGDRFNSQLYYDYVGENTLSNNVPDAFRTPGGVDSRGFKAPTIVDPVTGQRSGLSRGNPITKQYDFNVNVGGPIRKQRLWYFASYRDNNQYKTILGLAGEEAQSQLVNKTIKVTYQLTRSNQIIWFYNERSKFQPLRDLSLAIPVSAANWQDSKNRPQKIEWTSTLGSRAFLDVQASHWGNYFPLYPTQTKSTSTEGVPVGRIDLDTSQQSGASDYYHNRTTLKPQLSAALSYFVDRFGSHNFKFGLEAYRERRKFLRFQPGNIYYRDRGTSPSEVDIYNTPNTGIDDSTATGIYAQDSWNPTRRFTINAGARFDRYKIGWPANSFTPEQSAYFQPVSTPETTVADLKSISPRLGFAWDLAGTGRTVWKGYFGRFYYNPSTDISSLENPVGQAALRYQFRDLNGNKILDGPQELGNRLSTLGGAGFVKVDRSLQHSYGQEMSTHFEQEVAALLSARASYVFKSTRNGWAEVDLARVNSYTVPFAFTDIGPDGVRGTGDDRQLTLYDFPAPNWPTARTFTNPGSVPGVPALQGNYHTIELALNRRFHGRWLLLTSFEHTWADDFRNTTTATGALDVVRQATTGITGATDVMGQPNRRRLGSQQTTYWNYKVIGRYVFPYDFGVSGSYKLQSGYNWARNTSVPLANAGSESVLMESIDSNRTENVHIVDFRFEKGLRLARAGKVTGMIDLFNALNQNPIVGFRTVTGPRFKELIAVLDPRAARFGIRWDF